MMHIYDQRMWKEMRVFCVEDLEVVWMIHAIWHPIFLMSLSFLTGGRKKIHDLPAPRLSHGSSLFQEQI